MASNNPNGRPKGSVNKDKAMLEKDIQDAYYRVGERKKRLDRLWKKAFDMAEIKGDYVPIKVMLEQGFGRARERHEITGGNGEPLEIRIVEDLG
jgi:hypothetical protein